MKTSGKEILQLLFDKLWDKYVERVPYAKVYANLITEKGGKIVIDHIAFRTFNSHTGEQPEGIRAIKHILKFFDYQPVSNYHFSKKKLNAVHFEHPDKIFPKIFVSQLEVSELPEWAQNIINNTVKNTHYLLSDRSIALLRALEENGGLPKEAAEFLVDDLTNYFHRPWKIPQKDDVLKLNDISQYGAWVLLHGNSVNHFAAYINDQDVKEWPDLAATCKGLAEEGIPMKDEIEGEPGSKLRQSATHSVKEEVKVKVEDGFDKIIWTYAYLELTERNYIVENGTSKLFTGFLGAQASHLFDMTQTHDN
jgi:hypothetical protein